MIQRVVAFRFKKGVSEEAVRRHFEGFAALKSRITQIESYRGGKGVPLGAEAPGKPAEYHAFHYLTFAGVQEVDQYFLHPEHRRFVEENRQSWESVIVLNGEVSAQLP